MAEEEKRQGPRPANDDGPPEALACVKDARIRFEGKVDRLRLRPLTHAGPKAPMVLEVSRRAVPPVAIRYESMVGAVACQPNGRTFRPDGRERLLFQLFLPRCFGLSPFASASSDLSISIRMA